jgi:hypothetical protein
MLFSTLNMGFSIAWFAFRGKTQTAIFHHLGLGRTSKFIEVPDSAICGLKLPNNGYLIHLQNWLHPFLHSSNLASLSKDCELVGCQVEEHVMISCAFRYVNGKREWNILHELDKGTFHLELDGIIPSNFQDIFAQKKKQKLDEGIEESPDYIFDVPVDIAEMQTGFRHDKPTFAWGTPSYRILSMANSKLR